MVSQLNLTPNLLNCTHWICTVYACQSCLNEVVCWEKKEKEHFWNIYSVPGTKYLTKVSMFDPCHTLWRWGNWDTEIVTCPWLHGLWRKWLENLIPCFLITAPLREAITRVHVPERAGTQITDTRHCCFLRWYERTIEIPCDSRSWNWSGAARGCDFIWEMEEKELYWEWKGGSRTEHLLHQYLSSSTMFWNALGIWLK